MAEYKDEPKNIIVEFLRTNLTDPRGRDTTTETDTFSGTGASQTLTLTPSQSFYSVVAITDVSVGGSSIDKWQDYNLDLQNGTVTGTFTSGTDNIVVTYKVGRTTWIFPNLARDSLSATSYPRINVLQVGESADQMGNYTTELNHRIRFQIDIWVKDGYKYDDGTIIHVGDELAMYLARKIAKLLSSDNNEMYPLLFDYSVINLSDARWEMDKQCFHVIFEFYLSGIDIGE